MTLSPSLERPPDSPSARQLHHRCLSSRLTRFSAHRQNAASLYPCQQNLRLKIAKMTQQTEKACTECRQQKARCDAHLNPNQPCSRCVKVKAECIISEPFRREHKRQRRTELEREAEELRRKLTSHALDPQPSPIDMLTAAAEMGGLSTSNESDLRLPPPVTLHPPVSSYPQQLLTPAFLEPSLPRMEMRREDRLPDPTVPRSMDNIALTADEIDDLFSIFFHHYARFLPILDTSTSPNAYCMQSPFLFWAVIGVACRAYPRNPTLLSALSRSILEMALLSATSTSPWHTIQGLLLLLTWPFAKDRNRPDVTFSLCGMMVHIAMQNGLHIPMSSHEFSKVKIPAPSEADMIRRSELWAHCVIVYQNSCIIKGQLARTLVDMQQEFGQSQVLFQRIAPAIVLKVKCLDLITRCSAAVVENGVRAMTLDQERSLDIIIRTYESQIADLESQFTSADDKLSTALGRLSIQVFHFFKTQTISSTGCLARVLTTACRVIDCIEALGQKMNCLTATPIQINFGLLLASVSLLRILKGPASYNLDLDRARLSFFAGIGLAKEMSVEPNDTAAKTVLILNQLWNSTKAFRKSDGSEYTALRIRSRLVLSPVLDAVWWWRDEFDNQYRALFLSPGETTEGTELIDNLFFAPPHSHPPTFPTHPLVLSLPFQLSLGVEIHRDNPGAIINTVAGALERQEPVCFDDQFLADFEWALGEDALFPPTESYNSTWPSSGAIV
ncbi:Zn(II)2Cys6 transcription factor [Aspergillus clavatus NRRL 1]|uniref:C6 zinc finger domain protein n=1 Tax=Aspergillus clavatus (strain ATCC 1007 / CBS 513.65 / DSM 816 / NCTC 3887 / NRRL 1 / QM 1276 / 107) TaxID=344612 RepID=A1C7L5_ASPCL|nr:C6 zinc finger domain protein [Aspergillus clavatus NRRL 1]EAW14386.1 C6 zinc finger domain protein [Aspergillus clavatus NRRL 1]